MSEDLAEVLRREAQFHDEIAAGIDVDAPIGPPDQWEAAILSAAGTLEGKRILDFGCGDGQLSYHLLQRGATNVTGIDISPGMVDVARKRIARDFPDADSHFVAGDGHETGLESGAYDLIVGKWVLHHLELDRALPEIRRLLAPGGRGVFMETSRLNPLLALARTLAHMRVPGVRRLGTPDELPLGRKEIAQIRSAFPRTVVDFPVFWLLFMVARNVLRFRWSPVTKALWKADRGIERMRPLRRLSYFVRVIVEG